MPWSRSQGPVAASRPAAKGHGRSDTLVLFMFALALYLPLISWGIPHATAADRVVAFSTDDILPLGPLAELRNAFIETRPDRNYGYPFWHYFVAGVAQAPYLAYLRLSGGMGTPAPTFPFGIRDPVRALWWLTFIGRLVTVLMAAGIVASAYWFSRILWDRTTGIVAAALTAVSYLMVYYARTGNVDVPSFFWTALGAVAFALIVRHGVTTRRMAALGVLAALAMATKDQALVVFLPLGCALLAPSLNGGQPGSYPFRPLLVGLAASVAAYAVATGMVVDPRRHLVHVGGLLFHPEWLTVATGPNIARHARTLSGLAGLSAEYVAKFADAMSPAVLLAAVAGGAIAIRRNPWHLVFVVPAVLLFLVLAVPTGLVVRRYFLPLTLFVDAFAASLVVALWRSSWKPVGTALVIVLCGWRLAIAADLSYAQYHDTRYPASAWLAEHAHSGDRIEYFGSRSPLPHLSADVRTRRIPEEIQRRRKTSDAESIRRYFEEDKPQYVVIIPDWTSPPGTEHSRDCPDVIYRALLDGTLGYSLVEYEPAVSLLPAGWRPPLDYPTVAPPVRIFMPSDRRREQGPAL